MTTAVAPEANPRRDVVAVLLAEAVRRRRGALGVLVRDIPDLEPEPVLGALARVAEEGMSLRVAYIHSGAEAAAAAAGFAAAHFSTAVEQAERWRNQRDLDATIVVIATGGEDKISSLEDFASVTSRDLKRLLVERARRERGPASANEVQGRWWNILWRDDRVSFGQLLDYFLALDDKEPSQAVADASRELYRLGLLPDPAFFNEPTEQALRKRLEENRELVERVQTFTDKDRKTAQRNLTTVTDAGERAELSRSLRQLKDLRATGAGLSQLSVRAAQRLVDARRQAPPPPPAPTPGQPPAPGGAPGGEPPRGAARTRLPELAAQALVGDEDARAQLDSVVKDVVEQLARLEPKQLKPEPLGVATGSGGEVTTEARGDLVNLVARLIDEGVYGGLIRGQNEDLDAMIRRFHAEDVVLRRWERGTIDAYLTGLGGAAAALEALFAAYNARRDAILPLLRLLCVDPMGAAVAPSSGPALLAFVDAYQALIDGVRAAHPALVDELGADAQDLITQVLLLETLVFVREDGDVVVVLAPTHPLFLWHYTEYARIVAAQRDQLSEADRKLVAEAAERPPYFLTSLHLPASVADEAVTLTEIGRVGPLPVYGRHAQTNVGTDGMPLVEKLLRAFVDIHPSARLGLRVTAVNPPDVGALLALFSDLAEEQVLRGGHLLVVSQDADGQARQLRLSDYDEERIARLFHASAIPRRFTYDATTIAVGSLVLPPRAEAHLLVAFDQSDGRASPTSVATHPIQPLAVNRKLQFRRHFGTLELVPAPGGIFAAYGQMVGFAGGSTQPSYFSIHQSTQLRGSMGEAAKLAVWFVVADRHVDRDLEIPELRVFTGRDGGRDVVAFADTTDAFRRSLRDIARQYNTAISNAELDELLTELSNLLDAGVLDLRPDASGRVNASRIKGLLGTLIAVRHYKAGTPPGHERLVLSLDSAMARRWLHLSDDPQRADLVVLDFADDRFTISVVEVKAVQDARAEYQVQDGVATGPAVQQVLSTRRLLAQVFGGDRDAELITTPARRELLREHAFRELTKASYTPDARRAWADRLERLFAGAIPAELVCELAEVRLGVNAGSLEQRSAHAQDGSDLVALQLVQLNESSVGALRQRLPSPPTGSDEPPEGPPNGDPAPTNPNGAGPVSTGPDTVRPTELAELETAQPPAEIAGAPGEPSSSSAAEVSSTPPARRANSREDSVTARPRALLGTASGAYGKTKEVWFDPQLPGRPLPNPHMMITGETGSGKTQATKAILRDLYQRGVPALILDFKDDYSQIEYVSAEAMTVYDASEGGLAFNPMTPPVDPRTGKINVVSHVHQFSEIVKRIYELGDQQTFKFREALKELYKGANIPLQPFLPTSAPNYPAFDDLRGVLAQRKETDTLLGRLSPIFDLSLFAANPDSASFSEIVERPAVVRLSQLPGDEVKNAVAEFFLMALYNHLIRLPHPHALERLLVLDEAWRLVKSPFLEPLMREGRAFGLGVIVASQFPGDLPDHVAGSTATKLFFSQTKSEQVRHVQRSLVGKTSGTEAQHLAAALRELPPLTCFVQNSQYQPAVRTAVVPYFERASSNSSSPTES